MEMRLRIRIGHGLVYALLLAIVVFAVFPSLWMVATSVKPSNEVFTSPPRWLSSNPTFASYHKVVFESSIPKAFVNSAIVTICTTVLTLMLSILAGYGFSRYRFRGARPLSTAMLFGQMMPGVVIVMPLYTMFSKMHILDKYIALIIANMAITIPLGVMMLRSFFQTVPTELEEAAKIDGTTGLGALFRIILPISMPGITAVSVYTFLHTWEEFLFALNFTNSADVKTLPIAVHEFSGEFTIDWGSMMSASTVVSIPVLLIFILCKKYFIRGLAEGSVKG
jgi:ABC-type sugar transport system, permease component